MIDIGNPCLTISYHFHAYQCHCLSIVATGFPTGQTPLKCRLEEISQAVEDGASEIDVVINRTCALVGDWKGKEQCI